MLVVLSCFLLRCSISAFSIDEFSFFVNLNFNLNYLKMKKMIVILNLNEKYREKYVNMKKWIDNFTVRGYS